MEKCARGVFCRLVLGLVALSHITLGTAAFVPWVSVETLVKVFYQASVSVTPQLQHIVEMFGVYMFTVGILSIFALWDPVKNKSIINGIIILLVLRVIQRITFADQAWEVFQISSEWYWAQTILFFIIALVLFLLKPKAES